MGLHLRLNNNNNQIYLREKTRNDKKEKLKKTVALKYNTVKNKAPEKIHIFPEIWSRSFVTWTDIRMT